jgi:hypothetical protein
MRLLASLNLPLILFLILHPLLGTAHSIKPKAGATMDPNGVRTVPAPPGGGATTIGTTPGQIQSPTP